MYGSAQDEYLMAKMTPLQMDDDDDNHHTADIAPKDRQRRRHPPLERG
jgi:hypothetical protein